MRASGARTSKTRQLIGIAAERGQRALLVSCRPRLRRTRPEARPGAGSTRESLSRQRLAEGAYPGGRGARVGGSGHAFASLLVLAALTAACALRSGQPPVASVEIATASEVAGSERICAWYGDARDGVLYFGESAFWSAERAYGDPLADRLTPGPRRIGRFDLATRRLAEPLDAGPGEWPTGVWDVLAHPNGRVYFTTWFDSMGWVDLRTGMVHRLDGLGRMLNEIAPGPDGTLLVSRYGSSDGGPDPGSVLVIDLDGEPLAEHPLAAPAGYRVAPKTVAFDPARDEIWVTTDLFPLQDGPIRHDAYVLDRSGREKQRIESPEVQFVAFGPDGTGLVAEVLGSRLALRVRRPDAADELLLADGGFPEGLDFVQDIHFAADGRAVVTRWSGVLHVFDPPGSLTTLRLPKLDPGGLYYSGVLSGDRVCATHCGGISVVCAPAEPTGPALVR